MDKITNKITLMFSALIIILFIGAVWPNNASAISANISAVFSLCLTGLMFYANLIYNTRTQPKITLFEKRYLLYKKLLSYISSLDDISKSTKTINGSDQIYQLLRPEYLKDENIEIEIKNIIFDWENLTNKTEPLDFFNNYLKLLNIIKNYENINLSSNIEYVTQWHNLLSARDKITNDYLSEYKMEYLSI